ncbi:AAA family ATPase [Candidatus Marsarchaeota archaeon]|nr:AAA family ATPase [Candidatus Marsarchaeota archaeon]MCL5404873.1 AAA family ATPase [Candidatus Marsarchaeota archaeon]
MPKTKNTVILVLGSPGAGKTTLINSLPKRPNTKVINIGTLMEHEAAAEAVTRDRLRYLSTNKIRALRRKAFKRIGAMSGTIIVDTHATVEKGNKFIFGLPIKDLHYMGKISGIIYVDATPDELVKRRLADTVRKRENDDLEVLNLQRQINLAVMSAYGSEFDIPVYILHNKENKLEKSIEDFSKFVTDILENT